MAVVSIITVMATGHAFAWTKTASFENGSTGALANTSSGFDYAGTATTFSADRAASGSKTGKMAWTAGNAGWNLTHGELYYSSNVPEGGEIWARGYYFFKSPWSWGNGHIKALRIALNAGGQQSIIIDGGTIIASNEIADIGPWTTTSVDIDKWNCLEIYVKLSSTRGILRIWKNGVLVFEDTTRPTCKAGGSANFSYIMGTWNNNCPQSQTQYVDEFVITSDRPSQVDSKGNPMIGPIGGATTPPPTPTPTAPASPSGLKVTAN